MHITLPKQAMQRVLNCQSGASRQDWEKRTVKQKVKLGQSGLLPLEVRFLHDPDKAHGFCGAALSSNIIHFTKVSATQEASPTASVGGAAQGEASIAPNLCRLHPHAHDIPPTRGVLSHAPLMARRGALPPGCGREDGGF